MAVQKVLLQGFCAWVASWLFIGLLTIPLFHIHARHALELGPPAEAVLVHSVWPKDLSGEYGQEPTSDNNVTVGGRELLLTDHPNHSEYSVDIAGEENLKRKQGMRGLLPALALIADRAPIGARCPIPGYAYRHVLLQGPSFVPRAPPFVVS